MKAGHAVRRALVLAPRALLARRGRRSGPPGVPFLARLRVGRKLMLLVLLPVSTMLVVMAVGAVDQWREARTLGDFRTATRMSFAATALTDAVAAERIAAVRARLRPDPAP